MKRRTTEQGMKLVEKYRASGLGQEKFAKRSRINVATLRYWVRRATEANGDSREPVRFVELTPTQDREGSHVSIETPSGVIVRLNQLPSSDYLVELILGIGRE